MNNTNTTTTKITKGSTVKWQSQARFKAKKGTVYTAVKAGTLPAAKIMKQLKVKGATRSDVSYIIEGNDGKFYWPWTSQLKAV